MAIIDCPDMHVSEFLAQADRRVREMAERHAHYADKRPCIYTGRKVEVNGVIYPSARYASIETYIPEQSIRGRANGRNNCYVHPVSRQPTPFTARWIGAKFYSKVPRPREQVQEQEGGDKRPAL